jgi:hypothetical protein
MFFKLFCRRVGKKEVLKPRGTPKNPVASFPGVGDGALSAKRFFEVEWCGINTTRPNDVTRDQRLRSVIRL